MGHSRDATVVGIVYGGCITFLDERVAGQCAYEFADVRDEGS